MDAGTGVRWIKQAACRGMSTSVFFVEHGQGKDVKHAIAICRRCPVREDCLEYALANGERFGVWGGLTVNQREKVRDDRRAALWG